MDQQVPPGRESGKDKIVPVAGKPGAVTASFDFLSEPMEFKLTGKGLWAPTHVVEELRDRDKAVQAAYLDNIAGLTKSLLVCGVMPGAQAANVRDATVRGIDALEDRDYGKIMAQMCATDVYRRDQVTTLPDGRIEVPGNHWDVGSLGNPAVYHSYDEYLQERVGTLLGRDFGRSSVGIFIERDEAASPYREIDEVGLDEVNERFRSGVFVLGKRRESIEHFMLAGMEDNSVTLHLPCSVVSRTSMPAEEIQAIFVPEHCYDHVRRNTPRSLRNKLRIIDGETPLSDVFREFTGSPVQMPDLKAALAKELEHDVNGHPLRELGRRWMPGFFGREDDPPTTYFMYGAKARTPKEIQELLKEP